jgi:hypothetical protein
MKLSYSKTKFSKLDPLFLEQAISNFIKISKFPKRLVMNKLVIIFDSNLRLQEKLLDVNDQLEKNIKKNEETIELLKYNNNNNLNKLKKMIL